MIEVHIVVVSSKGCVLELHHPPLAEGALVTGFIDSAGTGIEKFE